MEYMSAFISITAVSHCYEYGNQHPPATPLAVLDDVESADPQRQNVKKLEDVSKLLHTVATTAFTCWRGLPSAT